VDDATRAAIPAYTTKHVTLRAEVSPDSPTVDVDRERIAEVLANLLANALRHTPAGGEVRVTAHADVRFAEIAISDTGEGVAPEHLDRIFERFYRVDPARSRASGGTGIGLAIVRAIVEAHHGTVTASSGGVGQGATFTIRLPVQPANTA
jgi:signal transduction histidine kinase